MTADLHINRLNDNLCDFFGLNNYSLENTLEASGLPDAKTTETEVLSEMHFNIFNMIDGPYRVAAEKLLNYGINVYIKRGLDGKKEGFEEWLKTENLYPHIFFKDSYFNPDDYDIDKVVNKFLQTDGELDLPEHYKMFTYYNGKMNEFNDACGI